MPKHTCGYLLQLRLIHSILHQATQGFANCVKFAIKLVCVWERKRGVCLCVYFVCMHTETHGDKFRHTHTHITTHKLQSVDVGKWYGLFHFGTAFEVSDCSPGLLSFKRILQHLKKWETNPEECLTLHYADGFYKRQSKHSLTGPPRCCTYLWWITADSHNLFPHLPLHEREELELVICHGKNFWHIQRRVNQCW